MKRLLHGVLVCLLVVTLAPTVSLGQGEAQDGAKSPDSAKAAAKKSPRVRGGVKGLKEELGLDDAQVKKMQAINQKYGAEIKSVRADTKRGPERSKKIKEIGVKRSAELKTVLSPEQYEKYEKQKAAKKSRGSNKPKET